MQHLRQAQTCSKYCVRSANLNVTAIFALWGAWTEGPAEADEFQLDGLDNSS